MDRIRTISLRISEVFRVGFFRHSRDDRPNAGVPGPACRTGELGMKSFRVCLEGGPEALACVFRCPFGNTYLCTRPPGAEKGLREDQPVGASTSAGPVKKPTVCVQ